LSRDLFGPIEPRRGRAVRSPLVPGQGGWRQQDAPDESLSVSAVNGLAKQIIEGSIPPLRVHGEVTGWKRYGSGHCYFCLRDADAQLRAVMFRADAARLPTDPEEGMQVRTLGTVTLYEKRGEYQFVVRELEGIGVGGLWRLAFERLRLRLEAEGLLAAERKLPIPEHPAVVGVVTSPVGAVLQDILNVVSRRAPWTRVVLSPAKVQGEGAAEDIARALDRLVEAGVADVIIIGRGGGSAEDLWAFNEECVARAIARCPVPVISAVGHETDYTIADLVADLRAPTPSAAAEHAVPDRHAIAARLNATTARVTNALRRKVTQPLAEVATREGRLAARVQALHRARARELHHLSATLDALSPLSALRRGYAVPLADGGRVLRRRADFEPSDGFTLRVADGLIDCAVTGTRAADDGENR
jgi:exodeoxyribonuclease VII large subunit